MIFFGYDDNKKNQILLMNKGEKNLMILLLI